MKAADKNVGRLEKILLPIFSYRVSFFLNIFKLVDNWYDVLLFRFGLKNKIMIRFRSGEKVRVDNLNDYFRCWSSGGKGAIEIGRLFCRVNKIKTGKNSLQFLYKDHLLRFYFDSSRQFSSDAVMLTEQFIKQQYRWLEVKDRDVIDIGANIGDSAVYFALDGARRVYAFEPYPHSYNLAVRNIKINKVANIVTILNEGCGGKDTAVRIEPKYKSTMSSEIKHFRSGKKIRISSLESIVKRYGIEDAALKSDCEGYEYEILFPCPNTTLRKFKKIMLEYHYGYLNIERKLKDAGFRVKHTQPFREIGSGRISGILYAERIDP